jgi:hypothetical protein
VLSPGESWCIFGPRGGGCALLPLDDVLGCLREAIPTLSRSALHRCLTRHGISRLPEDEEKASKRKRFAETREERPVTGLDGYACRHASLRGAGTPPRA